ncbi:glycosyltransferase [Propioniciclava tarda]|uniref:Glycosyltransferase n=1 Tax=Propioniciclava tarda TaxID=433330 RepID=A0A4V2JTH5_PROTD|nr:glycosyltransferase [Propioniciclava tarda]SMO35136.1 Glycosyltransferase involved in cell wall bisynthesis [Propioniciclava tarda]
MTPVEAAARRPLVSIVVPVYKVEEYLPRCLDSIVNQSYRPLEIIVVNDGSPDGCGDIMRDYASRDERLKLIFQENAGLGAARNVGVAAATGEFVCFIDSDDYVAPDYVSRMIRLTRRRGADVVICNFFFELPSGVKIPFPLMTAHRSLTGEQAGRRALDLLTIPTFAWNKLYRRQLFVDGAIAFPSIYYEDVATVAQILARAERVAVTHKPLYYYCFRKGGITGNFQGKNVRDYLRAVNIIRHFIWDEGLWLEWQRPYRGFLRRVETQLVVSIQSRLDLPLRDRVQASRMASREIRRLRAAPSSSPKGPDHGLDLDAEDVFRDLVPRGDAPRKAGPRLPRFLTLGRRRVR